MSKDMKFDREPVTTQDFKDHLLNSTKGAVTAAGLAGVLQGSIAYSNQLENTLRAAVHEEGHQFIPYSYADIKEHDTDDVIADKLSRVELRYPREWYNVVHHRFPENPGLDVAEFIPNNVALQTAREGMQKPSLAQAIKGTAMLGAFPAGVTLTAGMLLATGLSPTTRNYIRDSIAQHRDTKKLAELVMDEIEKRATNSALDEIGGK